MAFKLLWRRREEDRVKYTEKHQEGSQAYIRGYYRGDAYFEPLGTGDRRQALKDFVRRQAEIVKEYEERQKNQGRCNVAYAAQLWYGSDRPEDVDPTGRVKRILQKWATRWLDEITQTDLDKLAVELLPNASGKTRNREVYTPFISIYNRAMEDRGTQKRVWKRPRDSSEEKAIDPPGDEYVAKLLEACKASQKPVRDRACILMFNLTGDRTGAIVALERRNVDLDNGTVFFEKTKNSKPRKVSMAPILWGVMKELCAGQKRDARVFGFKTRYGPAQLLKRLQLRAGIDTIYRPHDVGRHSFGARLANSGMSRGELKKAGNWLSDASVDRYEHIAQDRVSQAVANVDTSKLEGKE